MKKHQPCTWARQADPETPRPSTMMKLLQAGMIEFDPHRKRFDPVSYVLSKAGREALQS